MRLDICFLFGFFLVTGFARAQVTGGGMGVLSNCNLNTGGTIACGLQDVFERFYEENDSGRFTDWRDTYVPEINGVPLVPDEVDFQVIARRALLIEQAKANLDNLDVLVIDASGTTPDIIIESLSKCEEAGNCNCRQGLTAVFIQNGEVSYRRPIGVCGTGPLPTSPRHRNSVETMLYWERFSEEGSDNNGQ